ncbi:phosphotransferase family protein [Sanguibacter sp. HDW7]|uniref:phosphotransferase family protein n=1 Tax=Sanguibacter sp. HDW7 TaxID=2714931 RepID=UPI00140A1F51|nr:aminoglycoside phosphotransferase family protein [Sanguibacter sp. HDW7]QIK83619.1 aminoglycoside phosphotransferase family protein [Sanguibacter sp. HDW7]
MTDPVPSGVRDALVALAAHHLPPGPLVVEPLHGGMFASTYRITHPEGMRLVAKVAPESVDRLLTYEHDVLATEVAVDRLAGSDPGTLVPEVLAHVADHPVLGAGVALFTHLDGAPWLEVTTGDDGRARVEAGLGTVMARFHAVGRLPFGYPALPALQGTTWRAAFCAMVDAVLADAARWQVDVGTERVRAALASHADALDDVVEPALVHTDLWEGNVLLDPATLAVTGVVDTERAVVGDPVLDVVGADQTWLRGVSPTMLDAYGRAAEPRHARALAGLAGLGPLEAPGLDRPLSDVQRRFLLYRLYFALLMQVEVVPRAYPAEGLSSHLGRLRAVQDVALTLLGDDPATGAPVTATDR